MEHQHHSRNRAVRWLASGAIAAGLAVGAAGLASAASGSGDSSGTTNTVSVQTDSSTPAADSNAPAAPTGAAPVDPASLPNGPGETVLTGTEAEKVTAAALAAEPGSTVIRVETDSSGHTYEAHVTLADGTQKTLYFNANFEADGSDTGFGPGPKDGGQHGAPPAGAPTPAPSDTTATG